jgi:hypothetical protein
MARRSPLPACEGGDVVARKNLDLTVGIEAIQTASENESAYIAHAHVSDCLRFGGVIWSQGICTENGHPAGKVPFRLWPCLTAEGSKV